MKLFQWHFGALVFFVSYLLLMPISAQADITSGTGGIICTGSNVNNITPFAFGVVDPFSSVNNTSATLSYECRGSGTEASARVCFTFGPLTVPSSVRDSTGPSNFSMNFSIFANAGMTIGVTPSNPLSTTFTTAADNTTRVTRTIPVYAQTLSNQNGLIPGAYSRQRQIFMTVNSQTGTTPPANCTVPVDGNEETTYKFPYTSSATVNAYCSVTTTDAFDFGKLAASATATKKTSKPDLIKVTCTNQTPYKIGLSPLNGNVNGLGVMTSTGTNGPNTATVPYQLQSDANGTIWGNTATSTDVGNGVAGTGTGLAQNQSVYATIPSADVKPDTYKDTVTINVNY